METNGIVFWVLLACLFLGYLIYVHAVTPRDDNGRSVSSMTEDAIIIAIIVVMGFVPQFGYITVVPGISLTLLHLPVLIGAYRGGWKRGLFYGAAFGVTSWLQALQSGTGLNAFFVYPWVSVLPRLLFGFFAGLFFSFLEKGNKLYRNGFLVAAISFLCTILHTVLVFADLFAFYPSEMFAFFSGEGAIGEGIVVGVTLILALGCLGESVLAAIFTPLVGKALTRIDRH